METVEPVRRASEIEEATNLYFIHPIASRLVPLFAALGIRPNAVSLAGMAFGILAGGAYAHYQDTRWAIAGFVLMIAWHVMDGADGQLARLTHTQSETGKVLDGICDYVTFIAVYVCLAATLSRLYGGWVWGLVAVAGACHAVQAAVYEVQRQEYNFWGMGRMSAELPDPGTRSAVGPSASVLRRLADLLYRAYMNVQYLTSGVTVDFHRGVREALNARPQQADAIRLRYREVFAPLVRRWSVMSSNYRTLGIFICALAKVPLFYFAFEIVGFSLIMILLRSALPARHALFFRSLENLD